jgi:hypothetical protein
MRWITPVVGIMAVLAGLVWTLQGVGVLGGSVMSGDRTWAIVGPIVGVAGLLLVVFSAWRWRGRAK